MDDKLLIRPSRVYQNIFFIRIDGYVTVSVCSTALTDAIRRAVLEAPEGAIEWRLEGGRWRPWLRLVPGPADMPAGDPPADRSVEAGAQHLRWSPPDPADEDETDAETTD